jgi:hypothetical protein
MAESMAEDPFKSANFVRIVADIFAGYTDLIQKEIRLARAELVEKFVRHLRASIWMAAAGLLCIVSVLLVVEGTVFAIASFGLSLHLSCFLMALAFAALAGILYYRGRSSARGDLLPIKSLEQVRRDIKITKEQFT